MFTFLAPKAAIAAPKKLGPDCTSCGLLTKCRHPKQTPRNNGGVCLVVDSPEDRIGGLAYDEKIQYMLTRHGVAMQKCTVIAASACPGDNPDSWRHCQPLLIEQLKALNPETIIPIGKIANQSLIEYLWQHPMELPDRWYGRRIPSRELNAWVFPIGYAGRKKNAEVSQLQHFRWLRHALRHTGRPYEVVPDYNRMVEILHDPVQITAMLEDAAVSRLSAFDYETNHLKSTKPGAKIYSASVAWLSDGKPKCVAFMMTPEIRDPWIAYLTSESYKIASNAKFEDRWSRHFYKVEVNNWLWDTMICAHMADPQMAVSGLKFQAFAMLGVPFYAKGVDAAFSKETPEGFNMIHTVDQNELLVYNGIDSLAELDLGLIQMYEAGRMRNVWSPTLPDKRFYAQGQLGC